MAKKIIITAVILLIAIGVPVGIKVAQIRHLIAQGQPPLPTEAITTAKVIPDQWQPFIGAVGSLVAVQGVTISAELDGKVVSLAFEPGSAVKAGDPLLSQDTSVEQAQLRSAESATALAKISLDRSTELLAKSAIAKSDYDQIEAQYQQAIAQADNLRSVIAKKTIRAPFAGRLGIRLVNLGQTLKAGDAIVSLQALDPIFANFQLPQQELSRLKTGLTISVSGDAITGKPLEGKITAINPDVDSSTRNVRVQATLTNSDELLHPGMFVNVAVLLPVQDEVLAIPASAVLYAPYGDSVFVVEEGKDGKGGLTVRQQFIRLGTKRGDFVSVVSGLKAGDTVASTGVFKLRNGGSVKVDNSLAPDAKLVPTPTDS
jgi:membrane fusion protein (multidrug efflux system)